MVTFVVCAAWFVYVIWRALTRGMAWDIHLDMEDRAFNLDWVQDLGWAMDRGLPAGLDRFEQAAADGGLQMCLGARSGR